MPIATANGIDIAYDTFGSENDPPLLLIMGLACQMIFWPDDFCTDLAARGFYVVRFDNRDVGLSSKFDDAPVPNVLAAFGGDHSTAAYALSDMAADAIGLMDYLGIEAAHIVGQSMGGMIAQTLAIEYPERALSLTSISSTNGDRTVGYPHPEATQQMLRPPATDREAMIEASVEMWRVLGGPVFPFDEDYVRSRATRAHDRCHHPLGVARQLMAILSQPDRTEALAGLTVPAAVIHGDADPLVDVSGGRATAAALPDRELVIIEGMGHDLPVGVWPQIIDTIVGVATRARSAA